MGDGQRRGWAIARDDLLSAAMAVKAAPDAQWTPAVAALFHGVLAVASGGGGAGSPGQGMGAEPRTASALAASSGGGRAGAVEL